MGATEMAIKGIKELNKAILSKTGEAFTIEVLDEMVFEFLGEATNDYDLKMIRNSVAYQEAPFSFVFVFNWQGTESDLEACFKSAALRHEWRVYAGEVCNARNSYADPYWCYVGDPRIVVQLDSEEQAMRAYEAIDPKRDWITEVRDRRNGYMVEVGIYSYSPDGSEYSCGLIDSKVFCRKFGPTPHPAT